MTAAFSVVIPAHNEERVIGRCLNAFVPGLAAGEAEVVVVPNGCTDRTAEIAAAYPGVTVVDLPVGSKPAALNAGDEAATALPRVYLDADIVISPATLRALVAALREGRPRVAAPSVRFALDGRPWAVRAFYAAYQRLPYVSEGLTGLGVFALSAEGRARFGRFPDVTADDLFVQRLFGADERVVLHNASFAVEVPRTLRALIAVRTRTAFGSAELAKTQGNEFAASTKETVWALLRMTARAPHLLPAAVVYVAVTVAARLRARRARPNVWQRDATTR
jgi:glycosyltransferase involved in cell wall biosynthesis